MKVRAWLFVVALFGLVSAPAHAGTYLDRAVLLLKQATEEADYLRARIANRELAEVVHKLAVARLDAARDMPVPSEVTQAHPHLLLVLENYERAANEAAGGRVARFISFQSRARDEEQIFRGILKQLGWPLPPRR